MMFFNWKIVFIVMLLLALSMNTFLSADKLYNSEYVDIPTVPVFTSARLPQAEDRAPVESIVINSAVRAGFDPNTALRIAECESSLDAYARNPVSTASGLYQFTDGTWEYIGSPGERFDPQDSVDAFLEWYPKHPEWWVCD